MEDFMERVPSPVFQEDLMIRSIKAKMEELRQENENLKSLIARITKDHDALIVRLNKARQVVAGKSHEISPPRDYRASDDDDPDHLQLVSLTLGRISTSPKQDDNNENQTEKPRNDFRMSKNKRKENCNEEGKGNQVADDRNDQVEEATISAKLKKARVTIKARCATPMINDGCQWRKYGQKTAKGNPCPRAYYRCTISPSCPVRKQVQRSAEDSSILNTTYEGTHNHPLPPAAIPMAFATSAATSRLLSSSSASSPFDQVTTTSAGLHYCFNLAPKPQTNSPFNPNPNFHTTNIPTCSIANYNPYYSHPTITIDLTSTTPSTSLPMNYNIAPGSSRVITPFINPNGVELGFQGFEDRSKSQQPFGLHQHHPMQNDKDGVSLDDVEKSNSSCEVNLAAAMSSSPSFQSVLADAIASYIANKGNG